MTGPRYIAEMRDTTARDTAHPCRHVSTRKRPYLSVSTVNDHQMWDRAARERALHRAAPPRVVAIYRDTDRSGRRHGQQAHSQPNSGRVDLHNRHDRRLPQ